VHQIDILSIIATRQRVLLSKFYKKIIPDWQETLRALLAAQIIGPENDSCRQKRRETILGAKRTHRQDRFYTNAILKRTGP